GIRDGHVTGVQTCALPILKLASVAALVALQCLVPSTASAHPAANTNSQTQHCSLNNGIQHVISITFDNTHLTRDRAGIASDLERSEERRVGKESTAGAWQD